MTRHLWRLSVIAYVLSWCVPVVESHGDLFNGRWWGWHALLFAISPVLGNDLDASWMVQVVMVTSALTNVLYLGAMGRAYLRPGAERRGAAWALVGASLVNASWPVLFAMGPDLRLGYYIWLTAFPLGAASLVIKERR